MWATQAAGGKEKCQEAFETRLPMLLSGSGPVNFKGSGEQPRAELHHTHPLYFAAAGCAQSPGELQAELLRLHSGPCPRIPCATRWFCIQPADLCLVGEFMDQDEPSPTPHFCIGRTKPKRVRQPLSCPNLPRLPPLPPPNEHTGTQTCTVHCRTRAVLRHSSSL